MDLEFFKILIEDRGLDISNFLSLYKEENYDKLFMLSISCDIPQLTCYLYKNFNVKFYISNYIEKMDKNFLEEINSDNHTNNYYKIIYKNNINQSLNELNYLKRYSKLNKDENGFYYSFNKKYLNI
jgi:hypothetical protein